jgi:hypothetical protein
LKALFEGLPDRQLVGEVSTLSEAFLLEEVGEGGNTATLTSILLMRLFPLLSQEENLVALARPLKIVIDLCRQ